MRAIAALVTRAHVGVVRAPIATALLALLCLTACGSTAPDDAGDGAVPHDGADADAGVDARAPEDAADRDAGLDARVPPPLDAGAGLCGTWSGPVPIRVLFVGNSQIEFWDLPALVGDLSESASPSCPRIVGEGFTLSGASLRDLWEGTDASGRRLADVIASREHDVVVIAESIDLAEYRPPHPDRFVTDATAIVDAARAAGEVPIFYATPYIEAADRSGFHLMADDQIALGATLGVTVAAGGLAWLRVWDERPAIDLYAGDRQHPGYPGSYISALVIYAAITGATPIGLTSDPAAAPCEGGACPDITPDDAALFQRAAWAQHLATGARP